MVSTDAGPFDTQFGRMHYGLGLAVEGGMRPADALEAATRVAAEACGVSTDLGTLETGKLADCLVVDGNPLHSIGEVAKVAAVYQGLAPGRLALSRAFRPTSQQASTR